MASREKLAFVNVGVFLLISLTLRVSLSSYFLRGMRGGEDTPVVCNPALVLRIAGTVTDCKGLQ